MSSSKLAQTHRGTSANRPLTSQTIVFSSKKSRSNTKSLVNRASLAQITTFDIQASKEDLPSPIRPSLSQSKSAVKIDRFNLDFLPSTDSFLHKKVSNTSTSKNGGGDVSTQAGSLSSLSKFRIRTMLTPQSLTVLPSDAANSSTMKSVQDKPIPKSMNDFELKNKIVDQDEGLLTEQDEALIEFLGARNTGAALDNLEENTSGLSSDSDSDSDDENSAESARDAVKEVAHLKGNQQEKRVSVDLVFEKVASKVMLKKQSAISGSAPLKKKTIITKSQTKKNFQHDENHERCKCAHKANSAGIKLKDESSLKKSKLLCRGSEV